MIKNKIKNSDQPNGYQGSYNVAFDYTGDVTQVIINK